MKKKILILNKNLIKKNYKYIYLNKYLKNTDDDNESIPLTCQNTNNFSDLEKSVWEIYKNIISNSKVFFNTTFKLSHTHKDYEVLLGTFAIKVSRLLAGRKKKLDLIVKKEKIKFFGVSKNFEFFSFKDSVDFSKCIVENDKRNIYVSEFLTLSLLKFYYPSKFKIIYHNELKNINKKVEKKTFNENNSFIAKFKNYLKNLLLNFSFNKGNIILYQSFLNWKDSFHLQSKLFQLPSFWVNDSFISRKINHKIRNKKINIFLQSNSLTNKDTELFKIFLYLLPTCYFEAFNNNIKHIQKNNLYKLSKKSGLIFTSNAHEYDEIFKLSIFLNKIRKKVIIGQHGCNYGTAKYRINPSIEELIFKYFLTWGWKNHKKNIKGFNFITNKIKKLSFVNNNKVLLVLGNMRGEYLYDELYDYEKEIKKNCKLINILSSEFLQVNVKPHVNGHNFLNEIEVYKKLPLDNIYINKNFKNLENLINKGDFLIFTYDATDFYKCLIINRPCLIIMNNNFFNTKKKYHKTFLNLENSKVVFRDFNELLKHIHYLKKKNIVEWWNSSKVQQSIKIFNKELNNNKENKIETLRDLLIKYKS